MGPEALSGGSLLGDLACLGAAACYALSAPAMTGLRALPAPSPQAWAALLGLALLSTALSHALFFRLASRAGPANAMLVTLVIPVTALILGRLALYEPITPNAALGAAVILAGLALLDGRWLPTRGHRR